MKSFLKQFIKFILVGGLLYWLSQRGFLSLDATKKAFGRWDLMVPAFLLLTTSFLISIYRFKILLEAQGITIPFLKLVELQFIGNFFNIALPGAVSGDVVKAIYVAKEISGKRAYSLSSILFDRVAGLSALILVATAALGASYFTPVFDLLINSLKLFVAGAGLAVGLFYLYLFTVKENHDLLLNLFKWLESKNAKLGSFTRIYEGIRIYQKKKNVVFKSLAMSGAIHLFVVWAIVLFTRALGEEAIQTLGLFVVAPLGLVVTAIPITPAGVGTGNMAFFALFHDLNSERGADVFNLFLFYQLFIGFLGGIVYMRFKSSGKTIEIPTELTSEG
jgi:glycosyltransferase 2 family protein